MDDFNFYNSENDGYRGGFGDYSDPIPTGGGPVQPGQPPRKKGGGKRIAALILACAIVGGGAGVGGAALYSHFSGSGSTTIYEAVEHPQVQTVVNSNSGKAMTPEQLYAANLGSCVGITVSTTTVNIFGQATTSAASGSGFVLTQDGYIVTNYHVIEEAANDSSVSVEVAFANGDKYTAKLVGGEKDNDVAVLKIDATGLTPVTLGDSSKLVVGQSVYAIGNPLGELTYSFTDGIVSALDRLITTSSTDSNGRAVSTTLNVLQTNCAINPGNSGGPLFDSYGNVVGIVSAKYTTVRLRRVRRGPGLRPPHQRREGHPVRFDGARLCHRQALYGRSGDQRLGRGPALWRGGRRRRTVCGRGLLCRKGRLEGGRHHHRHRRHRHRLLLRPHRRPVQQL